MEVRVSPTAFPRQDASTMADDGDALTFCSTCAFSQACLAEGMDKRSLMDLHVLVEHVGPFHAGEHIFREGDPFEAIAAVRAGTVKTYMIDRDGREHVLGFHLPGEVIGLDAIDGETYPCNAVALDTAMLCRFSFPKIAVLATKLPGLQRHLFRLLSRDIANYLRLAPETVSRVLRRFQKDGLLLVDRREVELLERDKLAALADPILHR